MEPAKDTVEKIKEMIRACVVTRETLPDGEWTNEPSRIEFKHAGYRCLLSRNPVIFNWCGYVGVPKGHPAYGKPYDDESLSDIDIHGGLTYAEHCNSHICHVTENSQDDLYWLGFDCAHWDDLVPGLIRLKELLPGSSYKLLHENVKYKNVQYVTEETKRLAEQLKDMEQV